MNESIIPFPPAGGVRVAPLEVRLIAEANQKRVIIAERAKPRLHALRAKLNKFDHDLSEKTEDIIDYKLDMEGSNVRPFLSPLGSWPKVLIAIMLALELPVNKAALDFLRLPQLESYALAIFFALVNFAAAKSTARVIRQEPFSGRSLRAWAIAFVANASLLLMIYKVAELRSAEAGLEGSSWTFFALQLAFYLATLFLSFLTIGPSVEDEQLDLRLKDARSRASRVWRSRAKVAKVYNSDLAAALAKVALEEERGLADIAEYRDCNLRARPSDCAAPSWFSSPIPRSVWRPIDMGDPIDEQPAAIRALIDEIAKKKGE